MKKINRANLYFLIIVAIEILVPRYLGIFYRTIGLSDIKLILFINHAICFIIPAVIYLIVTKSNAKETLRLNKISVKQGALLVLIAFLSQPIMMACSTISMLFLKNNVATLFAYIHGTPYIIQILLIAVMPAMTEEITVRGIILSGYEKLSDFKTALITGIFFGIFHLDGQQFLYAVVLGIILAYVVRITNSLFSSMLIHFIINGTSVTLQQVALKVNSAALENAGNTDLTSLAVNEKIGIIFIELMVGIVFLSIVILLIKQLRKITLKQYNISGKSLGI